MSYFPELRAVARAEYDFRSAAEARLIYYVIPSHGTKPGAVESNP